MNYLDILHAQLRADEGVRNRPYDDATGTAIVRSDVIKGNITIGIGRNLSSIGISRGEQALMFDNDLDNAERVARRLAPGFDFMSDVRKSVMVNLAFNMGYETLAEFVNTLRAVDEKRWGDAAAGLLASNAAKTAPKRFARLAESMRDNTWKEPA